MVCRFRPVKEGQSSRRYACRMVRNQMTHPPAEGGGPARKTRRRGATFVHPPPGLTPARQAQAANLPLSKAGDRTLSFIAPKVVAEIESWLCLLGHERRMSPKTIEAYQRDVLQFLGFLAGHLGGAPSFKDLSALAPADVRAYMAARRDEGISSRSLMRALAGVRGFARFLERRGNGKVGALGAVRTPKIPKTLPRPLAVGAAKQMADPDLAAGDERPQWIHARDAAVLALLYGSGLRISEALSLRRSDFASGTRETITVVGKGRKQRMVPV